MIALSRPGSTPVTQCNLCGGESFESLADRDRHGRPLRTLVCVACGLVTHADLPSEQALEVYYDQQYRREYNGDYVPSAYRVVRDWNRAGQLVERLQHHLPAGARVFDVGSGIGCTVKQFELAGFRAAGIEPGEGFCRFSQRQLGARIHRGRLQEVPPCPTHDLVLLVHVLEHLRSPRAALEHIRSILYPGGQLYIEVPNFADHHAAPGKQFHYAHIYNFTPAALASLGRMTGFEVIQQFPSPTGKDLMMLLRRASRSSAASRLAIDPRGYDQAVAAVRRHSLASYYARPQYIRYRLMNAVRGLSDRVRSQSRLRRILASCGNPKSAGRPRAALELGPLTTLGRAA